MRAVQETGYAYPELDTSIFAIPTRLVENKAEFITLFRRKEGPITRKLNLMPWTCFGSMTDADLAVTAN